jgi:hypothetical protein
LLAKSFPKADENFDEVSDIGKKMARTMKLNEIDYKELIVSIDFEASYEKFVFNIVKRYQSKDYPDGNAVTVWEKFRSNYEPVPLLWSRQAA